MPLYDFRCTNGHKFDAIVKLANLEDLQRCHCGAEAHRLVSAPRIAPDYAGYNCPVTGKWVEGRKAHAENLKRTGCRLYEPGEREGLERRKQAEEAKLDSAVDETVERFITELPAVKRDKLIGEVEGGLTATVERG
jgi:putative FmdB family regulatory protein